MPIFDKFNLDKLNKDELLSKVKNTVGNAADKAKKTISDAKESREQKKAEEAQRKQELEEMAAARTREILDTIRAYQNKYPPA